MIITHTAQLTWLDAVLCRTVSLGGEDRMYRLLTIFGFFWTNRDLRSPISESESLKKNGSVVDPFHCDTDQDPRILLFGKRIRI